MYNLLHFNLKLALSCPQNDVELINMAVFFFKRLFIQADVTAKSIKCF